MNFNQKKILFLILFFFAATSVVVVNPPTLGIALALCPAFPMIIKGVELTILHGIILSVFWMAYSLIICSPLYYINLQASASFRNFYVLVVYIPILIVFYKRPHEKASRLFLALQTVFWDWPLLAWMQIYASIGATALQPMYSEINESLSMGSLPISPGNVRYLREKGVRVVVNLCRESAGPVEEYAKSNIIQIRLPTPDLCEPSYVDVVRGIIFVKACLQSQGSSSGVRVFVHCKAGRGRSALFALCYLLVASAPSPSSTSTSVAAAAGPLPTTSSITDTGVHQYPHPKEIFQLLKSRRAAVESHILDSRVLGQFVDGLHRYHGDLDEMLRDALTFQAKS